MSFSADWLALRDPADQRARDGDLLIRAARAAGPTPIILDLGCGTGATVRAMTPHLPATTRWRLVDNDPDLLAHAATVAGDHTRTYPLDLRDFEHLPLSGATLVTASALLDLVSDAWLQGLAARAKVPIYAALSYDGAMDWTPSDARDTEVSVAFNRHQEGDKGFGPALGPKAVARAGAILTAAGWDVMQAQSPWNLGPEDAELQQTLLKGIAQAAAEAGCTTAPDWGKRRILEASQTTCRIGHGDILALPPAGR